MDWLVGVTAAPRSDSTLGRCVDSLHANDWVPTVFAEPGTDVSGTTCAVVQRSERLGIWHNWFAMARQISRDDASHVLTVQDDCEVVPFARRVLERFEWPERCAFVSLYLPAHHVPVGRFGQRRRPGIQHISQAVLHGSVCLAWRMEALRLVVESPDAANWPGYYATVRKWTFPWMVEDDDICIGYAVNALNLEMWYAVPGLAQHVSTDTTRRTDMGIRRSPWVAESEMEFDEIPACR